MDRKGVRVAEELGGQWTVQRLELSRAVEGRESKIPAQIYRTDALRRAQLTFRSTCCCGRPECRLATWRQHFPNRRHQESAVDAFKLQMRICE